MYFILKKTGWSLEFLIEKFKAKYRSLDRSREKLIFISNFAKKVEGFSSLMEIKMVKSLSLADLKTTLGEEAKRIIRSLEPLSPSTG